MQVYKERYMCTGCGACVNICPKKSIILTEDVKGFVYPSVDEYSCISCGACRQVCHTYCNSQKTKTTSLFAYINPDEAILMNSSSGGAFYTMAQTVLSHGGYVCGAVFDDDLNVHHIVTNEIELVQLMRGSKYLPSNLEDCFVVIKKLLNTNNIVLFSGTPCQVIALKTFLGKDYDKLYTVDVICYGIPSPLIYRAYLTLMKKKYGEIKKINFRDKSTGWEQYSVAFTTDSDKFLVPHKEDLFLKGFTGDLYNRESCSSCPAKTRMSYVSDITIGDLWGADKLLPNEDFHNGVSAVLLNNDRAAFLMNKENLKQCDIQLFKTSNSKYFECCRPDQNAMVFWKAFWKKGIKAAFDVIYNPSIWRKLKNKLQTIKGDANEKGFASK